MTRTRSYSSRSDPIAAPSLRGALEVDTVRPVGLSGGASLADSIHAASDISSREKILEIAESLFARRGYQGVGLREVARLAGLSKSALFHHFPSKLELYGAALSRILTAIDEDLCEPPSGADGPLRKLLQRIEALVDALAASPTRAPLLLRSLFEPEVAEVPNAEVALRLRKIIDGFSSLMSEGIEAGEIRAVPIPHAIQGLIGMLVFHFASGEFGDELLGKPVFSSAEIARHKEYVLSLIANGLSVSPAVEDTNTRS